MKRCLLASLLLVCLCDSGALAADPRFSTGGSFKSLNLFFDNGFNSASRELSAESVRFDLRYHLKSAVTFEFSLEQRLLWLSRNSEQELTSQMINRYFDLETEQNQNGKMSGSTQIDRLNLHVDHDVVSWTLGRQAIGFGRISLFSPLDIIAPFAPDALDVDVRPGVDAMKINRYFGLAGQMGAIAVLSDEQRHNSYLLTAGENVGNVDLLFLAGRLRGRTMVGIGLAGEIGMIGLKAEISWYHGTDVGEQQGDRNSQFSVAALEGWYRFDNGLVLIGEYLYNGLGASDPEAYIDVASSAPIQEGLSFLLGQHYLLLGPAFEIHPLVNLSGLLIYNLNDQSLLFRPSIEASLADNLQLELFWSLTRGQRPNIDSSTGFPVVQSEFGSLAESGGLFLRWYF